MTLKKVDSEKKSIVKKRYQKKLTSEKKISLKKMTPKIWFRKKLKSKTVHSRKSLNLKPFAMEIPRLFFFERLGSNSIPVLGLTQDQKFSNSVDNSLTQNTGAKKRWKIVRQLPKVGNFDLFSTKMSQILAWKAFNSGLKL